MFFLVLGQVYNCKQLINLRTKVKGVMLKMTKTSFIAELGTRFHKKHTSLIKITKIEHYIANNVRHHIVYTLTTYTMFV